MEQWFDSPDELDPVALDAELRAALGDAYTGASMGALDPEGRWLRLHFSGEPTADQIAEAQVIINRHVPAPPVAPDPEPDVQELKSRVEQLEAVIRDLQARI